MKKSLFIHMLVDLSIVFLLFMIKRFKENKEEKRKIENVLNDLTYDMEFVESHLKRLINTLSPEEI